MYRCASLLPELNLCFCVCTVLLERVLNPRNEISTSHDLDLFLRSGALTTDSGISVSGEKDVLKVSAAYAAWRIVSNTVSQVPLHLFRRTDDGGQKVVRPSEHNVAALIAKPNNFQHNMRFRKTLQSQLLLRNDAYAIKVRRPGNGMVSMLLPVHSSRVTPESNRDEFDLQYKVLVGPPNERLEKVFPASDIIHFVGESENGLVGMNPLVRLRDVFGLTLAVARHGARLFKNGAQLSGVLKHPGELGDSAYDRLKESIRENNQGVDNAFNVLILEEAMEWSKSGMTAEESQFLQTRSFQVIEIARAFGVPPHLLFELSRATFNNIEHQSLEFVKYFIQPHWENWEQQLAISLLTSAEQDEYFFEHDPTRLLRGDTKAVTEQEIKHVQWGIQTRNEVRLKHNWPAIDGLDEPLTPVNMTTDPEGIEDEEPSQSVPAEPNE